MRQKAGPQKPAAEQVIKDNHHRPHSALGNMPPAEFAMKSTLEKQAA